MALYGKVLFVATRLAGASTLGTETVGQNVISLDDIRDFPLDAGFVYIGDQVTAFTAVDRENATITLASALTAELPNGSLILQYPYAVQRWALVQQAGNGSQVVDGVWVLVPHALAGFLGPDGQRAEDAQEKVRFIELENHTFMIDDILNREAWLDPFVIPENAITETHIAPESITTPLLGANSVATQHLQAGSVVGATIDADALNGKTITGALIRSAASGRRVQMTSDGLVQFDADDSVIFQLGTTNKFVGDVDATSILVRDSLQMFGVQNLIANGATLTLKNKFGDPNAGPTVSYDYPEGPNISLSGWFTTAVHSNNGVVHSVTEIFWNLGRYRRADGKYWDFPQIPKPGVPGETVSEFKPWSMVRIARADTGFERVVMIGEDWTHVNPTNNLPETWIRVYDDSNLATDGSVAPTLMYDDKFADFSWFHQYRLARFVNGNAANRNRYGLLSLYKSGGTGNSILRLYQYDWLNADNIFQEVSYRDFGAVIGADNSLSGGVVGTRGPMQIDTTNGGASTDDMMVVGFDADWNGTPGNYVWNGTAAAWEANSYWPVATNGSDRIWTDGDIQTGTMTNYYAWNWSSGSGIKTSKYANNHKRVTTNVWVSYTWCGELNSGFESMQSPKTPIAYRRRAAIKVSVPALPPPIAGFGQPRDPAQDVYGWRYYIAASSASPATIHIGPNNPAMTALTALATSNAVQEAYPSNTGNQPPVISNFPNSSAAEIRNENDTLNIDGLGDIMARWVYVDYLSSETDLDVTGNMTVNDIYMGGELWIGSRLLDDTGWLVPTAAGGIADGSRYRRLNGIVYVYPNFTRTAGQGIFPANTGVFTLPTGFRPGHPAYFVGLQTENGAVRPLYVNTNGALCSVFNIGDGSGTIGWISFPAQ